MAAVMASTLRPRPWTGTGTKPGTSENSTSKFRTGDERPRAESERARASSVDVDCPPGAATSTAVSRLASLANACSAGGQAAQITPCPLTAATAVLELSSGPRCPRGPSGPKFGVSKRSKVGEWAQPGSALGRPAGAGAGSGPRFGPRFGPRWGPQACAMNEPARLRIPSHPFRDSASNGRRQPERKGHLSDSQSVSEKPLLGPHELASYLGVPVKTLYQWRYKGLGPPGLRIGRHVRYRPEDVEAWLDRVGDVGHRGDVA